MPDKFSVKQMGDKYRVTYGGEPQSEIDDGGFKSRGDALDAAMKANRESNKMGTGMADKARSAMQNRKMQLQKRMDKALGR